MGSRAGQQGSSASKYIGSSCACQEDQAHDLGLSACGGGRTVTKANPVKERSFPSPTWTRIPR
jgi:hypothetical protein